MLLTDAIFQSSSHRFSIDATLYSYHDEFGSRSLRPPTNAILEAGAFTDLLQDDPVLGKFLKIDESLGTIDRLRQKFEKRAQLGK